MANVTITDLPSLSTMTDADVIPVVNVGANTTQKITGANLKTYFATTSNTISNGTSNVSIPVANSANGSTVAWA